MRETRQNSVQRWNLFRCRMQVEVPILAIGQHFCPRSSSVSFFGSPNIGGNIWGIQANRKLDSFPPGEAISEIELRRLYPKYASFNIQKVGAITVLSVGSVVLDAPLRTWLIAYERKTVKLSTAEIAERRGRRSLRRLMILAQWKNLPIP